MTMLWTIFVILIVLWLLGMVSFTMGGFIPSCWCGRRRRSTVDQRRRVII
jgi:hypothetical protein